MTRSTGRRPASAPPAFPSWILLTPKQIPFSGFDCVLITHAELRDVIEDSRYAAWWTALATVQGVYLIADTGSGSYMSARLTAVSASSAPGRPTPATATAATSRFANSPASIQLMHATCSVSILRVFGPSVPTAEVDEAESHYKRALSTRLYGLNRN